MTLDVNWLTHRRALPWPAWIAVAAPAALAGWFLWQARDSDRTIDVLSQRLIATHVDLRDSASSAVVSSGVVERPVYGQHAKEVVEQLQWPWPTALDIVEEAGVAGVVLQSIDVSLQDRRVTIEFKTTQLSDALNWIDTLNAAQPEANNCWRWTMQETKQPAIGDMQAQAVVVGACDKTETRER